MSGGVPEGRGRGFGRMKLRPAGAGLSSGASAENAFEDKEEDGCEYAAGG